MKITIDLNGLPEKVTKDLEQFAKNAVDKLALDIHAGLVLATPVDTGRARAGWTVDTAGAAPIIENVVPYIGVLNNGHSQQAAAGFVEAVIDKALRT